MEENKVSKEENGQNPSVPQTPKKKNYHIGWMIVAAIVAIALIWWGISAIVSASRRNAAPLPKQVMVLSNSDSSAQLQSGTKGENGAGSQLPQSSSSSSRQSAKSAKNQTTLVRYCYDKHTRILTVTGDTASYKWLIPFIDTSTPLGRQTALIAASGDNVDSIMVYYILSTSPTVSSGKVKKVTLDLGNNARTDYYFLTSRGKTTRINAFKVTYDGDKITSIGDRAFSYNPNGLLQTVGTVLSMQFDKKGEMSQMNLNDTITGSQYQFQYSKQGKTYAISFTGGNSVLGFTESGTVTALLGDSSVKQLNTRSGQYTFEISD